MRDRTSKSLSRTRSEPAQLSRVSLRSPGPRPPGGRAVRAFGAHPTLAHHGSTARWPGCCARQAAPTSYYSPSVLRTFHGSQRLTNKGISAGNHLSRAHEATHRHWQTGPAHRAPPCLNTSTDRGTNANEPGHGGLVGQHRRSLGAKTGSHHSQKDFRRG